MNEENLIYIDMLKNYVPCLRKCKNCDNEFELIFPTLKYCPKCRELTLLNYCLKSKKISPYKQLKLRFLILLRDKFTCQYCGRKPPEVKLEIDHKYPKSKGGPTSMDNLITACRDCNNGKRDIILT